jgi:thymidylate synthase (FAD)
MKKVLDQGYIILKDSMGDDLTPVNAAKVSYDRASTEYGEREAGLTAFLANHDHTSPFRHGMLQFECYAPLMVARQWWKYIIGSGHAEADHVQDPFTAWNESSRRYITEEPVFYVVQADEWRSAPENKKQGSGETLPISIGSDLTEELINTYLSGVKKYEYAMEQGVCAEQARLFLPAYGLYVRWWWTASIQGVAHLIRQRAAKDAQKEFQLYAQAVLELSKERFPNAITQLVEVNQK